MKSAGRRTPPPFSEYGIRSVARACAVLELLAYFHYLGHWRPGGVCAHSLYGTPTFENAY